MVDDHNEEVNQHTFFKTLKHAYHNRSLEDVVSVSTEKVREYRDAKRKATRTRMDALTAIYETYCYTTSMGAEKALRARMAADGVSCKSDSFIMGALITWHLEVRNNDRSSRWGKVLKLASAHCIRPAGLEGFIKETGGIDECIETYDAEFTKPTSRKKKPKEIIRCQFGGVPIQAKAKIHRELKRVIEKKSAKKVSITALVHQQGLKLKKITASYSDLRVESK